MRQYQYSTLSRNPRTACTLRYRKNGHYIYGQTLGLSGWGSCRARRRKKKGREKSLRGCTNKTIPIYHSVPKSKNRFYIKISYKRSLYLRTDSVRIPVRKASKKTSKKTTTKRKKASAVIVHNRYTRLSRNTDRLYIKISYKRPLNSSGQSGAVYIQQ